MIVHDIRGDDALPETSDEQPNKRCSRLRIPSVSIAIAVGAIIAVGIVIHLAQQQQFSSSLEQLNIDTFVRIAIESRFVTQDILVNTLRIAINGVFLDSRSRNSESLQAILGLDSNWSLSNINSSVVVNQFTDANHTWGDWWLGQFYGSMKTMFSFSTSTSNTMPLCPISTVIGSLNYSMSYTRADDNVCVGVVNSDANGGLVYRGNCSDCRFSYLDLWSEQNASFSSSRQRLIAAYRTGVWTQNFTEIISRGHVSCTKTFGQSQCPKDASQFASPLILVGNQAAAVNGIGAIAQLRTSCFGVTELATHIGIPKSIGSPQLAGWLSISMPIDQLVRLTYPWMVQRQLPTLYYDFSIDIAVAISGYPVDLDSVHAGTPGVKPFGNLLVPTLATIQQVWPHMHRAVQDFVQRQQSSEDPNLSFWATFDGDLHLITGFRLESFDGVSYVVTMLEQNTILAELPQHLVRTRNLFVGLVAGMIVLAVVTVWFNMMIVRAAKSVLMQTCQHALFQAIEDRLRAIPGASSTASAAGASSGSRAAAVNRGSAATQAGIEAPPTSQLQNQNHHQSYADSPSKTSVMRRRRQRTEPREIAGEASVAHAAAAALDVTSGGIATSATSVSVGDASMAGQASSYVIVMASSLAPRSGVAASVSMSSGRWAREASLQADSSPSAGAAATVVNSATVITTATNSSGSSVLDLKPKADSLLRKCLLAMAGHFKEPKQIIDASETLKSFVRNKIVYLPSSAIVSLYETEVQKVNQSRQQKAHASLTRVRLKRWLTCRCCSSSSEDAIAAAPPSVTTNAIVNVLGRQLSGNFSTARPIGGSRGVEDAFDSNHVALPVVEEQWAYSRSGGGEAVVSRTSALGATVLDSHNNSDLHHSRDRNTSSSTPTASTADRGEGIAAVSAQAAFLVLDLGACALDDADTTRAYLRLMQMVISFFGPFRGCVERIEASRLIASFNVHIPCPNYCDAATRCAIQLARLMERQMELWSMEESFNLKSFGADYVIAVDVSTVPMIRETFRLKIPAVRSHKVPKSPLGAAGSDSSSTASGPKGDTSTGKTLFPQWQNTAPPSTSPASVSPGLDFRQPILECDAVQRLIALIPLLRGQRMSCCATSMVMDVDGVTAPAVIADIAYLPTSFHEDPCNSMEMINLFELEFEDEVDPMKIEIEGRAMSRALLAMSINNYDEAQISLRMLPWTSENVNRVRHVVESQLRKTIANRVSYGVWYRPQRKWRISEVENEAE